MKRSDVVNWALLLASLVVAVLVLLSPEAHSFISSLHEFGYFGAVLGGVFYTSGLTNPVAIVVLLMLSESLNPVLFVLSAALGAAVADTVMLAVFEAQVHPSVKFLKAHKTLSKYSTVIGFAVLALPLPDEIAVSLLGVNREDVTRFFPIAFFAKVAAMAALYLTGIIV